MSNIIVKIFGNLSTRIMFIFYLSIILITVFFIVFGYYTQLDLQKEKQYDKLEGIVSSTSFAIDGDDHALMMRDHVTKDAIKSTQENITYHKIHHTLRKVTEANGLESAMYTMVYNKTDGVFEFGVTSDENPYFRHQYKDYPAILLDSMNVGGTIPMYKDEHGTWLSAFHPIIDSKGDVVGVLQADVDFTEFINMVRAKYLRESLIALGVIIVLSLILIPYTRRILRQEEAQQQKLFEQSEIIKEKNRDITDSINYAQKIQNSILPSLDEFISAFDDLAVLYKPKDIVAGDFYYMSKQGDNIFIAAADCTGHGVPGAMVSVICSNALSHAINDRKLTNTGEILNDVREVVVQKFQGSPDGIKDGMDVSLCRFDLKNNELEYSGANNSIYIISGGELEEMKPDKQPVGHFDHAKPFTSKIKMLNKGDLIIMFSDGFADQFGGEKGKKLKYKPFKEILLNNHSTSLAQQMKMLNTKFENWMGDFEQVDDVCVIGVRI
ncbi:MAG: SpoIIE family protein phosphatase [Crocinitomicaceae bacterium]|nr:SpoIIE family protein phosphatase [Crocinitomicaceae bacterium]